MAPPPFRSRRRSRLVVVVVVVFVSCALLLSRPQDIGRALHFALFPPAYKLLPPRPHRLDHVDVIRYINPLIGTVNGGHVFPGATLPYGMAKAVADTDSRAENAAGFVSDDSLITGFSHMHDSGTGGNPSMGNFPLFVHPGCPGDDFAQCVFQASARPVARKNGSTRASPGYFAIALENGVQAEMTATQHVALYRFTFAADQQVPLSPLVLADLVDLPKTHGAGGMQVDPNSGRMVGHGVYRPSFGRGTYAAYFCADFTGAEIRKTGSFTASKGPVMESKDYDSARDGHTASAGTWVQFAPPPGPDPAIFARVGVSFLSTDQACANAEAEIPDWDMDGTVRAAQNAWRDKLAPVAVDATGVSVEMQTTFWSGLYRALLSPQNYTGENQLWQSDEPYYDSFYCIWDSFRVQHPLLTIVDPAAQTEMVRALVDIYRHEGKLPDCRMSFCKGFTQGGSNADVVIADAFVKGLVDDIDWATAYEAVVSDAEVEPKDWGLEGRGNLASYHRLGYIPWDDQDTAGTGPKSRRISRQVEYAYDDFAIAQLSAGLGDLLGAERSAADAAKYRARGTNWRHLWNSGQRDVQRAGRQDEGPETLQSEFVGFLQPRMFDGSWRYHSPRRCSPGFDMHRCYYDTVFDTYEGSPWLYSFYAPHDMQTLVRLMGGRDGFARRLHYFHASGIAYMGNEPTFLPVFQFHYAGRPALSAYWTHRYIPSLFNTSLHGIPGNDDCAMGAFSAFAMMGFFPVAGQAVYLLVAPFFPEVRLRARNGRDAVLRVRNFDPTYTAKYIQSATLNGEPYTRSWINHDIFLYGGVLEFEVGPKESLTWGVADEDLPPSYYD